MTATTVMLIVFAGFVVIGLVTGVLMGRRGHDAWMWGVLGVVFGPLVLPLLAVSRMRYEGTTEIVLRRGVKTSGPVAVLVGIDGSPEALNATRAAVELLADRLGSLTLATVLDLDAVDAIRGRDAGRTVFERDARELLDRTAAQIDGFAPATVVLGGRPAEALARYARTHDIDLIAIGARGRGLSEAVLGSVAEELVREPTVLALVAGRQAPTS